MDRTIYSVSAMYVVLAGRIKGDMATVSRVTLDSGYDSDEGELDSGYDLVSCPFYNIQPRSFHI